MATFKSYCYPIVCINLAIFTLVFLFSLTLQTSHSVEGLLLARNNVEGNLKSQTKRNLVLGSKPPCCEHKCLNCKPCRATLVIPSHEEMGYEIVKNYEEILSSHGDDDTYYLLSWKCRCGDKLFQP